MQGQSFFTKSFITVDLHQPLTQQESSRGFLLKEFSEYSYNDSILSRVVFQPN